jgi:chromosome segregation protein
LARRLAQIGVINTDDGSIALAVGQRIVTRDGRLRRWDGYVASGIGAAAADRLRRINRLSVIERELNSAAAAAKDTGTRIEAAQAALRGACAAADQARHDETQAAAMIRTATRQEDEAGLALERLELKRTGLAERLAVAEADGADAAAQVDEARVAVAALPDSRATAEQVEGLQAAAERAGRVLAEIRAEAGTLARAVGADRQRADAAARESADWTVRAAEAAKRHAEFGSRIEDARAEAERLADAPARIAAELARIEGDAAEAAQGAEAKLAAERTVEAALRVAEAQVAQASEALASARESRAGAAAHAEHADSRRIELARACGERFECPPPLLPGKVGFEADALQPMAAEAAILDRLTGDRERIGPVNLVAERELAELEENRTASAAEREELGVAIHRLRGSIGSLNREGRARLLAAFETVDRHFRTLFTTLFEGGQAHLELVDSDDPLEAGLEILAQPPGKKLATLTLLSGGEQALTAIALIFALFLTNPAPICVLDEVDAPLDDANIERFCDLLDRMTADTDTRYLIVTHNAVTMSRMHRLFGVTMVERGVSRLVSVDLGGAAHLLAAE